MKGSNIITVIHPRTGQEYRVDGDKVFSVIEVTRRNMFGACSTTTTLRTIKPGSQNYRTCIKLAGDRA